MDKINPHGPDGTCMAMDQFEERTQQRLDRGSDRMDRIEVDIKSLNVKVDQNNAETSEILELVRMGKGFFKTIGMLTKAVKFLLGLATAGVAFWVAVKGLNK